MLYSEELTIHFADSLLVFLIGMLVIFAALAILVGVVVGYSSAFRAADKAIAKRKGGKAPAPAAEAPAPAPASGISEETVAAITAAIACVLTAEAADGEVPPFLVKSIVRK